ncbi:NAD-dependent succinate-semialdehyde dehydrogenase [Brevibacillus fluminis]|uniref:NAD-dependent succinate-semialdehyde dehydrogenase n=1 Tax=Brevibacillus fluminis TaxID=511487 RepID=A0A3M8CZI1_9BACL|nr:NAD-dependent succinate-semialdehyde dehydrogenase [Brevibacillus fluminis]RNB81204.1 NAD-dependent succinate-semialdehyde dehydrogenase [Brevibacillus fluminis]
MYINGEWLKTTEKIKVVNPATGDIIDEVFAVGQSETDHAIQAASIAFSFWSRTTADERAVFLHKITAKLEEKREYLAELITKEMGKSIHNSRYEVASTISFFKWFAEEARRVYGKTVPASLSNKRIRVDKHPVGVVAAITPWNYPLSMIARKLGPALAAGCTVILKPSKEAPLSAVELFRIFHEVGLPKGVVNLVIGQSGPISQAFMNSSIVRKISFTGSTEVGKQLIRQSADTVKRVSMELGGHAPFIVFEDADIPLAIEGAIQSKFASAGQQCVCANRIYVHDKIYEEFSRGFLEKVERLRVGNGLDEKNQLGAMINQEGVEKVHEQVVDAISKGAKVLCGGTRLTEGAYEKGHFYPPTILTDVHESMVIVHEETFGPVAPLIRFFTEEEVIQKANAIEYGLASYFYTNDLSRMYRVSESLEYGMVGVNDPFPFSVQAPFGGIKESGLGREGGSEGIEEYLSLKMVSVQM